MRVFLGGCAPKPPLLVYDPDRIAIVYINAAAIANWGETASSADLAAAHAALEANLFGPWRVTQALLPLVRQSPHGRVVMVSSGAGSHGDPQFGLPTGGGVASYGISKAALNALTTKFAVELAETMVWFNEHGNRANIVALRQGYPGLKSLEQWLQMNGWGARAV